jgi:hypothetical protein
VREHVYAHTYACMHVYKPYNAYALCVSMHTRIHTYMQVYKPYMVLIREIEHAYMYTHIYTRIQTL